ncbi:MAG: nitrous oxide reductase accessory protein NosL, partial [Dehalococcoidia bacterium]|nr:nitrous oxide reductase accessory protein NosL [Dehalococcoidia bacterium]
MTSRRRFLILLGSAGVLGAGAAAGVSLVSKDEDAVAAEPTIHLGEEPCATCGMIIDDVRFAAGWIDSRGREEHFDDIGCLLERIAEHEPPESTRYFIHAYNGDGWLRAEEAHYAISETIRSPMAYGVAAFADAGGAQD